MRFISGLWCSLLLGSLWNFQGLRNFCWDGQLQGKKTQERCANWFLSTCFGQYEKRGIRGPLKVDFFSFLLLVDSVGPFRYFRDQLVYASVLYFGFFAFFFF